jgi:hypothetical protein
MRHRSFGLVRGATSNANTKWSSDQTIMRLDTTPGCSKPLPARPWHCEVSRHVHAITAFRGIPLSPAGGKLLLVEGRVSEFDSLCKGAGWVTCMHLA